MKKGLSIVVVALLLIMIVGCQVDQLTVSTRTEATIDGLKVILKPGITPNVMELNDSYYIDGINSKISARGINLSDVEYSMDQLLVLYNSAKAEGNYPDVEKLRQQDDAEIEKVKADFPSLTTDEIMKNLDSIINIYQKQVQYVVYQDISQSSTLSRVIKNRSAISRSGSYPGGLNSQEFWLIFFNLAYLDGTQRAANNSSAWAYEKFPGTSTYRDRGDAYRHSVWNALICCYVPAGTKQAKLNWAKTFTDAHENGSPTPDDVRDNAMDFHNNSEGRTWFASKSSESWFLFFCTVNVPSDDTVKSYFYTRALNGRKFTDNSQLPGLAGNLVYFVD